jgi:hypothetical protein
LHRDRCRCSRARLMFVRDQFSERARDVSN